jgi:hypothetical protein
LKKLLPGVQRRFTAADDTEDMADVLAIATDTTPDDDLVEEVARRRPLQVTIVIDAEDAGDAWVWDETEQGLARRDRLARLLTAVERRTGARVMGRIGDLQPLRGRWFDGIVDPTLPGTA